MPVINQNLNTSNPNIIFNQEDGNLVMTSIPQNQSQLLNQPLIEQEV